MLADSKNPYSVRALLASFESERCNNGATVQKTDPCLGFPSGRRWGHPEPRMYPERPGRGCILPMECAPPDRYTTD